MSDTQNSPFTINRFRISVFVFACVLGSSRGLDLGSGGTAPKTDRIYH